MAYPLNCLSGSSTHTQRHGQQRDINTSEHPAIVGRVKGKTCTNRKLQGKGSMQRSEDFQLRVQPEQGESRAASISIQHLEATSGFQQGRGGIPLSPTQTQTLNCRTP